MKCYDSDRLCRLYNHATNPRALRTDHEHKRNRQLARAVIKRLYRIGVAWHFDENGRAIPDYNWKNPTSPIG